MSNDLSDEDKELFRKAMLFVKPLKKPNSKSFGKSPIGNHNSIDLQTLSYQKECYLSDFIVETVMSHTCLSYCHKNIPSNRFNALKNGKIPWEARLDLHGLQTEAARDSLINFIQSQASLNKRCLLIIHGKGGSDNLPPVIKNLVNRWLPQLNEVLAFHSAQNKDGGTGALYVLLKSYNKD